MRIRSIKPEFWRSDDVNAMTIEDRLLFIGLWSYVDDNGVGRDQEASIVADLFAHDLSVSPHDILKRVHDGLKRLHALGVIHRYTVENRSFIEVVNWSRHQKINRPATPRYPRSDDNHAVLTEPSLSPQRDVGAGAGEQGSRGTGEQLTPPDADAVGQSETAESFDLAPPEPLPSNAELFKRFWAAYPRKDDKGKALEKFKAALSRADAEQIIAGAERYRDDPNRDPGYTKLPTTWLNADAWDNGPLPAKQSQQFQSAADRALQRGYERHQQMEHDAIEQPVSWDDVIPLRQIGER